MDSDMKLLRRKITQQINREIKDPEVKSAYKQGYIAALGRVVHLIDKMKEDRANDDFDQHRHSGLLEED